MICQALSELGVNYLGVWAGFGNRKSGCARVGAVPYGRVLGKLFRV